MAERLEQEAPVLDEFWAWTESALDKALPKSKLGKALSYAQTHKEKLMNYLKDGSCSISNNLAENCIRPFTIGRNYVLRKFMFSTQIHQ